MPMTCALVRMVSPQSAQAESPRPVDHAASPTGASKIIDRAQKLSCGPSSQRHAFARDEVSAAVTSSDPTSQHQPSRSVLEEWRLSPKEGKSPPHWSTILTFSTEGMPTQ